MPNGTGASAGSTMIEVIGAAAELQAFLSENGWPFAFIGGVANLSWGELRSTRDVDVTVFTAFTDERAIASTLLAHFKPRHADALNFALQARVVLLVSSKGIGIDVGFAGFEYEKLAIERSVVKNYGRGIKLRVISPEDLVVMKAFAGRDQDWADISGVARRQGSKLDWAYIQRTLMMLAEATEEVSMVQRALSYKEL